MSGLRHLLDTNVAIGYLDGSDSARHLIDQYGANTANSAISQITRIELLSYSALSAEEEARIQPLLAAVPVILLDDRIERETIAVRRRVHLKLPDAIIAATASVHGLQLLTLDARLAAALRVP